MCHPPRRANTSDCPVNDFGNLQLFPGGSFESHGIQRCAAILISMLNLLTLLLFGLVAQVDHAASLDESNGARDAVERYIAARQAGDIEQCLDLLSDSAVVLRVANARAAGLEADRLRDLIAQVGGEDDDTLTDMLAEAAAGAETAMSQLRRYGLAGPGPIENVGRARDFLRENMESDWNYIDGGSWAPELTETEVFAIHTRENAAVAYLRRNPLGDQDTAVFMARVNAAVFLIKEHQSWRVLDIENIGFGGGIDPIDVPLTDRHEMVEMVSGLTEACSQQNYSSIHEDIHPWYLASCELETMIDAMHWLRSESSRPAWESSLASPLTLNDREIAQLDPPSGEEVAEALNLLGIDSTAEDLIDNDETLQAVKDSFQLLGSRRQLPDTTGQAIAQTLSWFMDPTGYPVQVEFLFPPLELENGSRNPRTVKMYALVVLYGEPRLAELRFRYVDERWWFTRIDVLLPIKTGAFAGIED